MKTTAKQNGVTFIGMIMFAIVLVLVAIFSLKLIPVYMDDGKIQKSLDAMVRDPALQSASADEIRNSFSKRVNIMDGVTVVSPTDLDISKDNGRLTVSAPYNVKIPFAGNASLLIEFKPSASK